MLVGPSQQKFLKNKKHEVNLQNEKEHSTIVSWDIYKLMLNPQRANDEEIVFLQSGI